MTVLVKTSWQAILCERQWVSTAPPPEDIPENQESKREKCSDWECDGMDTEIPWRKVMKNCPRTETVSEEKSGKYQRSAHTHGPLPPSSPSVADWHWEVSEFQTTTREPHWKPKLPKSGLFALKTVVWANNPNLSKMTFLALGSLPLIPCKQFTQSWV